MVIKRVILGISGGIDSAVAGYLLKIKGFEVQSVFMKNWDEVDEKSYCPGEKDWEDAQLVCKHLEIPLLQKDFVKQYWNNVFSEFISDYSKGLTPNPDVLCNRHIKFENFFKYAINNLNGDAFATGHYAKSTYGNFLEKYDSHQNVKLLQPKDDFKDQTFFLSQISQDALRKTMFPLADKTKTQVKDIAKEIGLNFLLRKRESTGICFIGHRDFKDFISDYIDDKEGDFVDIDTGQVVGKHKGIHHWTIGQGCRIGGVPKPYFVAEKCPETNTILIALGTDHPSLFSDDLETNYPHFIDPNNLKLLDMELDCEFRFQHTKPLVKCRVQKYKSGLKVKLAKPLRALTPGQYAVFYLNQECLGSARIVSRETEMKIDSLNVNKQIQ